MRCLPRQLNIIRLRDSSSILSILPPQGLFLTERSYIASKEEVEQFEHAQGRALEWVKEPGSTDKPILNPFTINSAITRVSDPVLDSFRVEAKGSSESRQEVNKLVRVLSRLAHDLRGHLNSVNIATLLHRIARLADVSGHQSWIVNDKYKLIERLLFLLASCPGELDPSVISMVVWSLARLGKSIRKSRVSRSLSVSTFVKGLVNQAKQKPSEFTCRDSTVLLQGLHGLQIHPGMPFLETLAENAKKTIEHASTNSLTRLPWWLASLQYSDYKIGLFQMAAREVETRVHANNVNIEDAGVFLAALVKCEIGDSLGLCTAVESRICDSIGGHRLKDVVRLVEGFAQLGYRPSLRFISDVSESVASSGEFVSYHYLIRLLQNYAIFGLKCDKLVGAVTAKLQDSKNMTPIYVCMACSALAQVDGLDLTTWKSIMRRMASFRYMSDSALRMIYKGWLQLSCATEQADICDGKTLTACRGAWKKARESTSPSFVVEEAVDILTDSGYECSEAQERAVDLDIIPVALKNGSLCILKEFSASSCFINHPNKLKGDISWKMRLVRKLGWKVHWIDTTAWELLETGAEKLNYLEAVLNKDEALNSGTES